MGLGVLRRIPENQCRWVSRIFLVPKKVAGDYRMVVDLRHVNSFAQKGTAEVETLAQLSSVLEPRDHLVALDLSDGYYHFRIHSADTQYFQFRTHEGAYELVGLNMGWTRSPGVFTDFLRPVVRYLRRRQVRLLWYLDDFLVAGRSRRLAARAQDTRA